MTVKVFSKMLINSDIFANETFLFDSDERKTDTDIYYICTYRAVNKDSELILHIDGLYNLWSYCLAL